MRVQASRCSRGTVPERRQLRDHSLTGASARLPQSDLADHDVDIDPDDDLIKPALKRPIRLKNEDVQTRRAKSNREALGGMRNPRNALHRLPNHEAVGKRALRAMTETLNQDSAIQDLIFRALGDGTKKNKGPRPEQILAARRALY